MALIEVDGQSFEADENQNLLEACLTHKLDLPYFCWHPAMGSVGACRQCAVIQYQDEEDDKGRLVMACMTPVTDGARLSLAAPRAKEFRSSVIEWLMENHPHDCPVCEEGGECHLQDMTVMTGHTSRRYRGRKRTYENQYLGPFIGHEMNRCITCFRCVRYYHDYAGGDDLQAFGSKSRMYFGRESDGVLESEFAGNLVEVCPTGVFTDKPFSQTYTRKWDLQSAPSICPGCAAGCNILPGERYGTLKRVHNRYHSEVNGYFLCDRGRFGSYFVNSERRLNHAGVKAADGAFDEVSIDQATVRLSEIIQSGQTVGIGSPRASVENNFALRALVGEENFSSGVAAAEARLNQLMLDIHADGGVKIPSCKDVESADAVLILGEDVLNTLPRVALSLRQTVRNRSHVMAAEAGIPQWQDAGVRGHAQHASSPLFMANIQPSRIDDIATRTLNCTPEIMARVGHAIAHRVAGEFADAEVPEGVEHFVSEAAAALSGAQRPLIISGSGSDSESVLRAAANVAWALSGPGGKTDAEPMLLLAPREANTVGVSLLADVALADVLERLVDGTAANVIIMENDLFRRADSHLVEQALKAARHVVVLDSVETATVELATDILPVATYAESTGSFVNYEGRAQRFFQVFEPAENIHSTWRWLADAAEVAGRNDMRWRHVDEVIDACDGVSTLNGIGGILPDAGYRSATGRRIPRMTHRVSGRTAKDAAVSVHEPKPTVDDETPFAYSMEGLNAGQPGGMIPYVWSPGWNSNQSVFKFQQEVAGELLGGESGASLLRQDRKSDLASRFRNPPVELPAGEGVRLLPLHRVFGSDELSALSPPVDERSDGPQVVLNGDDAAGFGLSHGDGARCEGLGSFEVVIQATMAHGNAGVVVGLRGGPCVLPEGRFNFVADPDFKPRSPANLIARG